eukprot:TRINITY_DN3008_c0_g2_i2.p1 TRINITY_DN3008_c0_g2~~TRINITY_DN3008_c0_g2_i2.p1  ORF type:complete len:463 (-),score=48.68 TRINITY_DN3008_c0_g2_i2:1224-2612(-)
MTDSAKYSVQDNHYQSSLLTSQDQFRASGESRATEDWTMHEAPNGKAFYHNQATGVTQWEKPVALIAAEAQQFNQTQLHHSQSQVQSGQVQLQSSGQSQVQNVSGQGLQGQIGGTNQLPQGVPSQLKQENQSPQVHHPQPVQGQGSQPGSQVQSVQGQLQQPGVPMPQPAQGPLPHVMQGPRIPRLPVPLPRPAQGPILHSLVPIPHPMQHSVRGPLPQPGGQPQLIPRPMQQNVVGAGPPQPHSLSQNALGAQQGSGPMLTHAPNHGLQQPSHTPHVSAPPIIHQRPPVHAPTSSKPPAPASSSAPTSGPQGANLFVFGIPEDMGDQKLAELFSPYGSVIYAKVGVEKDTGRGKGYGSYRIIGFRISMQFKDRKGCLDWTRGAQIYLARKHQRWPGGRARWKSTMPMPLQSRTCIAISYNNRAPQTCALGRQLGSTLRRINPKARLESNHKEVVKTNSPIR